MATRLTPKKPPDRKPTPRKVRTKKASPGEAAANGAAAPSQTKPVAKAKKRLPAATIRALKELEADKLTRYVDADDLFQKLGIKVGKD
jgi:hypothetical protein